MNLIVFIKKNNKTMKKIIIVIGFLMMIALMFSCVTSKYTCPTYANDYEIQKHEMADNIDSNIIKLRSR